MPYEQNENINKEKLKKNHTNSAEEYSNWIGKFTRGAQQQTDYQEEETENLKASHLKWSSHRRKEEKRKNKNKNEKKENEESLGAYGKPLLGHISILGVSEIAEGQWVVLEWAESLFE